MKVISMAQMDGPACCECSFVCSFARSLPVDATKLIGLMFDNCFSARNRLAVGLACPPVCVCGVLRNSACAG